MRYEIIDRGVRGHCCCEATVVDTGDAHKSICECFSRTTAARVAQALNAEEGAMSQDDIDQCVEAAGERAKVSGGVIYNLLNCLFGTPPTVERQLRRWRRIHPFCVRMEIPSNMYDTLLSELRAREIQFNYDYNPAEPVERGMNISGVLTLPSRYVKGPRAIQ